MSDANHIAQLEAQIEALRAELAARTGAGERYRHQAEADIISVHHRMRNLLASVRSIAWHTAEHARDVEDYVAHFDGRLAALARCQSMLNRSADLRIDLEEMVREEFLSHALEFSDHIALSGPMVRLDARTGEALALAVHELTANAVKFGALSHPGRLLNVEWRDENGDLVFDWNERGAAHPVRAERRGFGVQFIEQGLPFQLGARTALEFMPDGVRGHIETPIARALSGRAP